MAIQLDYGGFDPSFFGVTLRYSSARAWSTFDQFRKADTPLDLTQLERDEAFEALSATSVISHEVRHFHDFLLTPYSARIFKLRIQLLVNTLQTLPLLFDDAANCIPIPITTWCGLNQRDREKELAYLPRRLDDQRWIPVSIPHIEDLHENYRAPSQVVISGEDQLKNLIRTAVSTRRQIDDLIFNPNTARGETSFQTWQVLELSGLLIQLQDIYYTYGADESQIFIDYLMSHSKNPYAQMLKIAANMWENADKPFDIALTSAMVTWSLLGSYERDQWDACPGMRFILLWHHLSENGLKIDSAKLPNLFDSWSEALGLSTVAEGLEETERTFHRAMTLLDDFIEKHAHQHKILDHSSPVLQKIARGVVQSSDHMIARFRNSPLTYVDPYNYIGNVNEYVSPVLRFIFDGGGLKTAESLEELERKGYIVRSATKSNKYDIIVSMIEPFSFSQYAFVDALDVSQLADFMNLTDFLFAETSRAGIEIQRTGRTFFEGTSTIPIEIQTRGTTMRA